jgi:hypothetical protein
LQGRFQGALNTKRAQKSTLKGGIILRPRPILQPVKIILGLFGWRENSRALFLSLGREKLLTNNNTPLLYLVSQVRYLLIVQ